jgi:putative tricarboxylic transport membrane protein
MADLAVLLVLASASALYCYDAIRGSTHIYNLILVLPLTVLVLGLCIAEFVVSIRTAEPEVERTESPRDIWPVMLLFAVYVVSLRWLGFDVGTCLFVGVFLYMQGERRWSWLIGYSIAFAFVVTYFFREMLPYPMPTLVIDSISAGGPL